MPSCVTSIPLNLIGDLLFPCNTFELVIMINAVDDVLGDWEINCDEHSMFPALCKACFWCTCFLLHVKLVFGVRVVKNHFVYTLLQLNSVNFISVENCNYNGFLFFFSSGSMSVCLFVCLVYNSKKTKQKIIFHLSN